MRPFLISIPHSGEIVPPTTPWLTSLPEPVLMRDVDRYVDGLYLPVIEKLKIPSIVATCHRYVIDLNRYPNEFDAQAVEGAPLPAGKHPKGLHWSVTTLGETLIPQPMSMAVHEELVKNYYSPFHEQVKTLSNNLKAKGDIFHLDLHSMPSMGTAMHNDPGGKRADVVVSDFHGKSSRSDFVELIKESYSQAGFEIAYNWPYFGGGITQMYGRPDEKHHTVQIELNRALYMDETTKKKNTHFKETQTKLAKAIQAIYLGIEKL
jgi:N-formylglutamate deformylase